MKALVKAKREPGLWLQDVPEPECGPNDVLIRVKKTGVCGTDLHIYKWNDWAQRTIPVPMTIGHEVCGVVHQVGSHVDGFKVGERVSAEGHVTCGYCRNCRAGKRHLCRNTKGLGVHRPGCFAELVSMPASNVFRLPKDIPDEVAAFLDPLGNAVHTALSFDMVGEDVLITGAGPIGIMAAAIARHVGARYVAITDVNDYRLALAKKMGAYAVNSKQKRLRDVMKDLGMTEGFDVGLEMSGSHLALNQMIDNMIMGGRIALLGTHSAKAEVDWNKIVFKMLHLKGIYGREMFETWYKMTALVQGGMDITPVITHRMPVEQFQEGFDLMGAGKSGKIVLNWE